MRSPRRLRPHSVVLKHKTGEDNQTFEAKYETTHLRFVKISRSTSLNESSTGRENDSSASMVVDLNDYIAKKEYQQSKYVSYRDYSSMRGYFTIAPNDILIWKDKEYTVKSINEIAPLSDRVEFLEVTLNG